MKHLVLVLALAAVVAGVFYGRLLHERDKERERLEAAASDALAHAKDPKDPSPKDPGPKDPGPKPTTDPKPAAPAGPERLPALTPGEQKALEPVRAALARARFQEAQEAAGRLSTGAPSVRLAARLLGEQAQTCLALTRAVPPHVFAGASDLFDVTLASGATHTARIVLDTPDNVVLSLADGRTLEVRAERITKREPLGEGGWGKKQRAELERRSLGLADAGALEVYHLACEALENGLPELGVPLLEKALALPGGGAVVDVYGSGDLELLHRTQERIRVEAGNPGGSAGDLALAPRRSRPRRQPVTPAPTSTGTGGSDPTSDPVKPVEPRVSPTPAVADPGPEPDPATGPEPEPIPASQRGLSGFERLIRDGRWIQAQDAYKEGVDACKRGYAARSSAEKADLKRARTLLEKARGLLDGLPNSFGDDGASAWDEFSGRVSALLRDVKKRQAATGS